MLAQDIMKNAAYLDEDFGKCANTTPCLKMLMESNKKLPAGTVLQVVSVSNISVPKRGQEESRVHYDPARHCLKLTVTDGSLSVPSYIFDGHPTISDQTPPGTKLRALRDVAFKSKALIFSKDTVESIGGHVKHLVEGWRVGKDLDRSHNVWGAPLAKLEDSPDAGPPRWKAFDFKQGPVKLPQIFQNPRSKPAVKEDEEKTSEFDQQRKANISKLAEQLGDLQVHKTFGEGKLLIRKDVADIMKEGFSEAVAEDALRRFKTVKSALKHLQPTNGADDKTSTKPPQITTKKPTAKLLEQYDYLDEDTPESRAEYERQKYSSGSKTLFDFVQKAIPSASATTSEHSDQGRFETEHRGRGRGQFNNFRRGRGSDYPDFGYGQERHSDDNYYHDSGRGFSRDRGERGGYQRRGRGGGRGGSRGGSRSFYRSRGAGL